MTCPVGLESEETKEEEEAKQKSEESAYKISVKILFPMLLLILPAVFIVLAGPAVLKILEAFK